LDVFTENNSGRKPEGTTLFGRKKPKREDNIQVDAQKVKCVSACKIKVGISSWGRGGGGGRRSLLKKAMKLSVS